MGELSRRLFTQNTLDSVLTYSLLAACFSCDVFGDKVSPITTSWFNDLNQLGLDLKDNKISQLVWQEKLEELYARVQLAELLELIDFDKLTKTLELKDKGARSLRFSFPKIAELPDKFVYGKQVFALKKGRSVVPHGHNNMATAFMVLKGNFHGRHYDRVEDEKKHMIIKPTIDAKFGPGKTSSISDVKDNVHWFKAQDEPAFIYNIHVFGLNPESGKRTSRVYVDPNGEKLDDGLIRARLIDYKEAHQLYG